MLESIPRTPAQSGGVAVAVRGRGASWISSANTALPATLCLNDDVANLYSHHPSIGMGRVSGEARRARLWQRRRSRACPADREFREAIWDEAAGSLLIEE